MGPQATLLDEIDEMIDAIKQTHSNMERVYAVYLPHFPEQSKVIDDLNQLINAADSPDSTPVARHDKSGALVKVDSGLNIAQDVQRIREQQQTVEAEQPKEKTQEEMKEEWGSMALRTLFRKINQLCHPDKCKRFSHIEVKKLREVFDDAHRAYADRDRYTLNLLFIRACYIRGELDRLPREVVQDIQKRHTDLVLDFQALAMHPLYQVLFAHMQGQHYTAKIKFGEFLVTHIQRLNDELERVRKLNAATKAMFDELHAAHEEKKFKDTVDMVESSAD
ncbi:hypothetical protein O152_gp274 [Pseudomonas phage PaBG]|uniref:Uncharacterized protein n=1 Tax=Pseudomonas phage PaBG TaxID=1335230 RepID=S5VVB3_9CAUD|nr:hypothetical protein O152_gp274 [Pseudomonas phage PaBG]AGS82087.1 hypothetical protein PaBG_00212 [Pseudomonas phage PaBG]